MTETGLFRLIFFGGPKDGLEILAAEMPDTWEFCHAAPGRQPGAKIFDFLARTGSMNHISFECYHRRWTTIVPGDQPIGRYYYTETIELDEVLAR
jgi:hypothetical protein